MYNTYENNNYDPYFETALEPGEKIHWAGKPLKGPYFLETARIPFFALCFGGLWLFLFFRGFNFDPQKNSSIFNWMFVVAAFVLIGPLWQLFRRIIAYRQLLVAVTDKKIIFRQGIFSSELKVIYYSAIISCELKTTLIDRIYGVKRIKIFTGEMDRGSESNTRKYDVIEGLKNGEELFRIINTASGRR